MTPVKTTKPLKLPEEATAVAPASQAMTPMQMLSQALERGASIDLLEKLMGLQERWQASQARQAFDEAIAAAKAEIPVIRKNAKVGFEAKKAGASNTNYNYESLGEIAETIDPILARHGLSYRWRSSQGADGISVTCILSHKGGHFEETTLKAMDDKSGNKNFIQAIASTTTYLSRYTLKMALGLATKEMDDDGKAAGAPEKLSDAQVDELITLAEETEADLAKVCEWIGAATFADIPAGKFQKVKAALEMRKRSKGEANAADDH